MVKVGLISRASHREDPPRAESKAMIFEGNPLDA